MIKQLMALVPDSHEWVEVRALLLAPASRILGDVATSPLAFVVVNPDDDYGAVVGQPPAKSIATLASQVSEFAASYGSAAHVRRALPTGWHCEEASISARSPGTQVALPADLHVRLLGKGEVAELTYLPDELYGELQDADGANRIIGSVIAEGRPVAFCYAGSVTETLWDVSIDTFEPFRRRGFATAVFEYMASYWAERGRQPVWDAFVSNEESRLLAAKLGFHEVARHWLFERDGSGE